MCRPCRATFADAALANAGLDTYLLDLHAQGPPAVRTWLTTHAKVRLIGPRFDAADNAAFHLPAGRSRSGSTSSSTARR